MVEGAAVEARCSRRAVRAFDLPGGHLADAEDLSFDYLGNVSSMDDVQSANNHRANSEFDLWVSRRFYLGLPFAEYYQDPFQNLEHRFTDGVGVGYNLIFRRVVGLGVDF